MIYEKYAKMLSATTESTLDKIIEYEREGRFNDHLDGENAPPFLPVDENFEYLPKPSVKRALQTFFIIDPFERYTNKKLFRTQVTGKENLQGLHSAIVVCNHVNKLDCMAIKMALRPKKTYVTAANFNNMQGFLGDMMRAGGMLPFGETYTAMKHFDAAIETLLKEGNFVAFFPERAEWWGYEKPRPLFSGAHRYAVKNNVPLLPLFITFTDTEESKKDRTALKQFTVHIAKPVEAPKGVSYREGVDYLVKANEKTWQEIYENFYHKN